MLFVTLVYALDLVHTIRNILSDIIEAVIVYEASANQSKADVLPSKYPLIPLIVPLNAVTDTDAILASYGLSENMSKTDLLKQFDIKI